MLKLKMYKTKIPSDINLICSTIKEIFYYLGSMSGTVSKGTEFEIKVVLNELILNAVKHGNKENIDKYVKISAAITSNNNMLVIIEDEGEGYDHDCLLRKVSCYTEDSELCKMKISGRGLMIVTNLCEKVKLNKKGNRITVLKKLCFE